MPEEVSTGEHLIRQGSVTPCNDAVAILGNNDSLSEAPLTDPSYDLYCLNNQHRFIPPNLATCWFQMHRPGSGYGHIDEEDHRAWLHTWGGCPVFMCDEYRWAPKSVAYPIDEVTKDVGPPDGGHYYTSSLDFMTAWAIHVGYRRIALYGVDMVLDPYMPRRASLQWYLGVAAGRGCEVFVSPNCALLKAGHIYGFEDYAPTETERTKKSLAERMRLAQEKRAKWQRQWEEGNAQMNRVDGYLEACEEFVRFLDFRERGVK